MSTTTRQERERIVLDHNQHKTIRDIAKEARMSFRDIGAILNKASEDKESEQGKEGERQDGAEINQIQLSMSTKAYKLFSEGKTAIEVAVALNVRVRGNQTLQRVFEIKSNARPPYYL
jgi:hypothetical protein